MNQDTIPRLESSAGAGAFRARCKGGAKSHFQTAEVVRGWAVVTGPWSDPSPFVPGWGVASPEGGLATLPAEGRPARSWRASSGVRGKPSGAERD